MKTSILLCLLFVICTATPAAGQRTWIVKPDGTGDAPTIQAAIDSAAWGDEVLVDCGTYYEHDIDMKPGVRLHAWIGGDCATIDANWEGRVFRCVDVDRSARIEGFTITGGIGEGGGMYLCRAWLTVIANCTFERNFVPSGSGGGLYCVDSKPTILGCTFLSNEAEIGGGVYCEESSLYMRDCTFAENTAYCGGGLFSRGSSLDLHNCTFASNVADGYEGGGMYAGPSYTSGKPASSVLDGCVFFGNSASGRGGALRHLYGCATVTNCTFSGNSGIYGGAIFWSLSSDEVSNLAKSIIAFNARGGAVHCVGDSRYITATFTDIFGNVGGDWPDCLQDDVGKYGNFSLDPLFCDVASDDYTLMQSSPCAPGNHPKGWDVGLIGALPVGCSDTAVEHTTWGRIKTLFR